MREAAAWLVRLSASAALLSAVESFAEEGPELFFDTVDVELVTLDVVVTGGEGHPVEGLARDDFEVLVEGTPVPITHFLAVGDEVLGGEPSRDPGLAPEAGPDLVVVVEDRRSGSRSRGLAELVRWVQHGLDPGQRLMVVTAGESIRVRMPFTDDEEALASVLREMARETPAGTVLESHEGAFRGQLEQSLLRDHDPERDRDLAFEEVIFEVRRVAQEARALADRRVREVRKGSEELADFVKTLGAIPGRKALLYLGDGLSPRPADPLVESFVGRFEAWIRRNRAHIPLQVDQELMSLTSSLESPRFDAGDSLDALAREAAAGGVVFYPYAVPGPGASSLEVADAGGSRVEGGPDLPGAKNRGGDLRDRNLHRMARATGGIVSTRGADLTRLLARVERDFSSYYSLGFDPPFDDGSAHGVAVRVRGHDVTIRHRGTVRGNDPREALDRATLAALHFHRERNPLEARLVDGGEASDPAGEDRERVEVVLEVPFRSLLLVPQGDRHVGRLSVTVVVADGRGGVSPVRRLDLPLEIPNDRLLEVLRGVAAFPLWLEIREGRSHRVAVGVRDELGRVDATLTRDLESAEGNGLD